ncbi:hypothetical protein SY83_00520 [Paenibacillus swuensis]|uniref:HTH araC/xylS-type domain-containing protein n=1 Tax=Paenibacillus swuensis TaxID=1178515 RepID=A0A172TE69_9BACL|nr:AraC family transcriptional regulator [Paenibacillus swuensis]ANE45093.1 hypothetical protein SY83_00520 [Paenibacillus swuensis]
MLTPLIYYYMDMMEADFPFKMELRTKETINCQYHAHEHLQLCYITKGICMHHVEGQSLALVKGDLMAIPPFLAHRIEPVEGQEVELVQLDYMPVVLGGKEEDLVFPLFPKIRISPRNQIVIEELLNNMKTEHEKREQGYQHVIKGDLLKLLVTLFRESKENTALRHTDQGGHETLEGNSSRRLLLDTVRYIHENLHETLSLDDIARRAALSPNYYSYMFKVLKGQTFVQYINDLRIRKAMDLLCETDLSTTQICFDTGFNNTSHFHRVFKKSTGLTPLQYRSGK